MQGVVSSARTHKIIAIRVSKPWVVVLLLTSPTALPVMDQGHHGHDTYLQVCAGKQEALPRHLPGHAGVQRW
jgi:hypothetical protein